MLYRRPLNPRQDPPLFYIHYNLPIWLRDRNDLTRYTSIWNLKLLNVLLVSKITRAEEVAARHNYVAVAGVVGYHHGGQ